MWVRIRPYRRESFSYCYQRTGTLWEGRYQATLIDTESYLLTCMRYIELNPVRAGMASHPSEYPWSSYRHNALGQSDELVTAHQEYRRLNQTEAAHQSLHAASATEPANAGPILLIQGVALRTDFKYYKAVV